MFSEESKLSKFFAILIAFGLIVLGFYWFFKDVSTNSPVNGVFGLLILVSCLVSAATLIAPAVSSVVGSWLGDALFYRRAKLDKAPECLDRMEGLMLDGKYHEAVEEVKEVLFRDALNIDARALLFRIYLKHLQDRDKALEVGLEYFNHPAHKSNGESVELLLAMSDLLDDKNAAEWLAKELKRGNYSNHDAKLLKNRLNSFRDLNNS